MTFARGLFSYKSTLAVTCTVLSGTTCIEYTEIIPAPSSNIQNIPGFNYNQDYHNIVTAVSNLKNVSGSAKRVLKFRANVTYNPIIEKSTDDKEKVLVDLTNSSAVFVVDGQNAFINMSQSLVMAKNYNTENATYMNLKVDYREPTFTQAIVTGFNSAESKIYVTLDNDFSSYQPVENLLNKELNWANSPVYRFSAASNKYDFAMLELSINGIYRLGQNDFSLIIARPKGKPTELDPDFSKVVVGDKLTFRRDGSTRSGHMFSADYSGNILFKNISVYNTRKWAFGGLYHTGDIIHDGVRIEPTPNTSRLTSGIAGGIIYSQSGRGKLIIKDSYIAANFDDAINIGSTMEIAHHKDENMIKQPVVIDTSIPVDQKDVIESLPSPSVLYLRSLTIIHDGVWRSQPLKENDELVLVQYGALLANKPVIKGKVKVVAVQSLVDSPLLKSIGAEYRLRKVSVVNMNGSTTDLPWVIVNDEEVGLFMGGTKPLNLLDKTDNNNYTPALMTRFFNLSASHPNSLITNNLIENKVRSGIMVRGNSIAVVGNTIRNVDGYGIDGETGYDSEEGMWSYRSDYSGNIIVNAGLVGIRMGMNLPGGKYNPFTRPSMPSAQTFITNNYIMSPIGVSHKNIDNVYYARNIYSPPSTGGIAVSGQEIGRTSTAPEVTSSLVGILPENNTISITHKPIFKVTSSGNKLYYVTARRVCAIPSMTFLNTYWGGGSSNLISVIPQAYASKPNELENLPAGRFYVGNCLAGEQIYRDAQGNVYRKERDEALCRFKSDTEFMVSTGLTLTEKKSLLLLNAPAPAPQFCKL